VSGGDLLLLALLWCAGQLALFAILRMLHPIRNERAIFLLHVAAFVSFAIICAAAYVRYPGLSATVVVGALSLNAIYCLSFLELWSLAEGGYSISMLKSLKTGPKARALVAEEAAAIGDRKRDNRIAALQNLGLVGKVNGTFTLTPRGQLVASAVALLRGLANFRNPG